MNNAFTQCLGAVPGCVFSALPHIPTGEQWGQLQWSWDGLLKTPLHSTLLNPSTLRKWAHSHSARLPRRTLVSTPMAVVLTLSTSLSLSQTHGQEGGQLGPALWIYLLPYKVSGQWAPQENAPQGHSGHNLHPFTGPARHGRVADHLQLAHFCTA